MASLQATKNVVTLKGSTATVTEFFQTALSSILYQRGVYPPESFEPQKRYGLTVMVVKDAKLGDYLGTVVQQFKDWLSTGNLQRVVLVIAAKDTKEVQERWAFNIETDKDVIGTQVFPEKAESQITSEIQAIIRQITASVTFLPLLTDSCTIDILAYTDRSCEVPKEWYVERASLELDLKGARGLHDAACGASFVLRVFLGFQRSREESDPRYISNAADVKLRSFSTKVHSVGTLVSYKAADDDML